MSSRSKWVFSWILKIALPNLHPGSALSRVNKLNSDASPQEISTIDGVVGNEDIKHPQNSLSCDDKILSQEFNNKSNNWIMPNAQGGLCSFRKINRNCVSHPKYKGMIAATKSTNIMARAEVGMILCWL